METGTEDIFDLAVLTSNEFDLPATLVPVSVVAAPSYVSLPPATWPLTVATFLPWW